MRAILIVIDGFGIRKEKKFNAIAQARKPNYDLIFRKYPHTQLKASGKAVGLPDGEMGTSEVGHLHLGAGRIVWQPLEKINNAIRDKSLFKNATLDSIVQNVKSKDSKIHLIGLCSDGGIHSSTMHLKALMEFFHKKGVGEKVIIHFISDGRDVAVKSAEKYAAQIEQWGKKYGGTIATICGRFYAMDRDNNWDRTLAYYKLLTESLGGRAESASEGIRKAYEGGTESDYYIKPAVVGNAKPIRDNDSVLVFNFRTDRARQITKAFVSSEFDRFERAIHPKTYWATFTEYDKTLNCPIIFEEEKVANNLGETVSRAGLRQLRIAETDKYPHVTYFFNSQNEEPYKGEERIMVPSSKVPSYDQKPEMSADGITASALSEIGKGIHDFILINFANPDLVGHSANHAAIITAVEKVDECIGKIYPEAMENNYALIVTSDHGNAEETAYPDGLPKASHTTNPVPLILVSEDRKLSRVKLRKGGLIDVAPTLLKIMGLPKPAEMKGKPLF
ncbi:MAG TPA: 2,3-bisphosphoglycerate-independent phosphoglycerate mutase [Candidatus Diapherotrites archaeon]|uniref:2,3-bisphosphoglycerate-independent phosphoglycerate mutase n=1 Tax=Candidatus Iainarchaeum sp. TaxID=3101447 RepID=A0A7J4IUV8_9ARCH|nr:2,3-bisphosphoglycerate-independent phosphoglycerate mutase [Candidatus Diapherotrites archaeon]